ncbi:hypothetical protein OG874_23535 [Nocardia sp. NBC_00565]|uniref:hypothetical protein n=1 Tax=Nocardia sp. NBC_00565 TaxID=2975993 RepID=UPI002E81F82A|nr:hypothetical protein [Nocardia sp. NBC_00565]WUB99892.1 hypothetical protein OG874_23535 [Nocardia sp. NBC_00565]
MGNREVRRGGFAEAGRDVQASGKNLGPTPPEFVQQWQQPFFASHLGGGVTCGQAIEGAFPLAVSGEHCFPSAGDGRVDRHARRQLVVGGGLSGHSEFSAEG